MELKLVMKTARSLSLELADGGTYNTIKKYEILLNGCVVKHTNKVITSLFGLKPDTTYEIAVREEGKKEVEAAITVVTDYEFVTLNVKEFGAKGDGIQNDTPFIQAAIMACPKMGRVLVPAGNYKITSLFLKSHIRFEIEKDAVLVADDNRHNYPILPGMIESYDETDEYNLGTWEGNPLKMFAGIITGLHVENVILYGEGMVNGNSSFETWWKNPKVMNIAFRPRTLFLSGCNNITIQGLTFKNSPSWTLHPYFSDNLHFCDLFVNNPAHSPNTDGLDPESCTNVKIEGVRFSLGDDCIAVKSGKIYMGRKHKKPSFHIHVRQCLMEDGHGAVTIGSEMAGGVKDLVVEDCIFRHTDRGLRIKTRRGRGKDAIIDNVIFKNINMDHVMTPFVVNTFYFCDPDGKSEYVQSRECYPVDERTPEVKRLVFENITCDNCHVAAAHFDGLPEKPIEDIEMRNISVNYAKEPKEDVPAMSLGVERCTKKGIYANNVKTLVLENVVITGQDGEVLQCTNVENIIK